MADKQRLERRKNFIPDLKRRTTEKSQLGASELDNLRQEVLQRNMSFKETPNFKSLAMSQY